VIGSELRRFVTSFCHSGAFPISMLPARKTDPPVRGAISGGWQTEKPGCVSCVTGSIVVGVVAGDSMIISAGLMMVGMVDVESAESSAGVETTGAVAVDSAEMLVGVVAGDSVIIPVGLMMVGMVGVQSAESSAGVETIGILAVDSAEMLVGFIVINWKRGDRLTQIRNESLAC